MKCKIRALLAVAMAVMVSSTALANDEQIAQQIVQRLQQQKQQLQLRSFNIGLQVDQGTVTMMGTVLKPDHAVLALDVARRVPGVKLVVNDLFIQPQAQTAENTIAVPATETQPAATFTTADKSSTVSAPQGPAADPNLQPGNGAIAGFPATQAVATQPIATRPKTGTPVAGQNVAPAAAQTAVGSGAASAVNNRPLAFARAGQARPVNYNAAPEYPRQVAPAQYNSGVGGPMPMNQMGSGQMSTATYDNPQMPGYAWPTYAAYPNYGAVSYPHQYSPTAWPYIGPFYPYPQVPLGWRKVTLEWDDGWWFLDFKSK